MYLPQVPVGHQFRILIAEDDPATLRLAALPLKASGFDVFAARDGLEARTQLPHVNPHLILADLTMPRLSGLELIGQLRRVSAIPIVVMTGQDSDEVHIQALKMGADDYITKPFTPQLLAVRITASLRRTYRYNGPVASKAAPQPSSLMPPPSDLDRPAPVEVGLPRGFVRCDACSYVGPEWKFDARDTHGNKVEKCPRCQNKSVTFAL